MINFNNKIFFINNISYKKISKFRTLIKIEPFNNSYCDNLGNFIKRTLILTSYKFIISLIKFYNIHSEYTKLYGIKEDLSEIIENINKIIITVDNGFDAYLLIKKLGPCIVYAKDIFSDKKVKIFNPFLVIANITEKTMLFLIMYCKHNSIKSNICDFKNKFFKSKIIEINNFVNPILNINYFIKKKKINKKLKILFIDIETNGSIEPEKCFKNCIFYIKKYFKLLFSIFYIKVKKIQIMKNVIIINSLFLRSIDNLELSIRASNYLKKNNIFLLGDLLKLSEQEFFNMRENNYYLIKEILSCLEDKNLKLNTLIKYNIII